MGVRPTTKNGDPRPSRPGVKTSGPLAHLAYGGISGLHSVRFVVCLLSCMCLNSGKMCTTIQNEHCEILTTQSPGSHLKESVLVVRGEMWGPGVIRVATCLACGLTWQTLDLGLQCPPPPISLWPGQPAPYGFGWLQKTGDPWTRAVHLSRFSWDMRQGSRAEPSH